MKQFLLQLSLLLVCFGIIQANEEWEVESEGAIPPIYAMKYVNAEKDRCIACGSNGMILFSTDGGNNFDGNFYTKNDWVTIEANSEVTVLGVEIFSKQ